MRITQTRSCARFRRPRQKSGPREQTIVPTTLPAQAKTAMATKGAQRSIPKVPSSQLSQSSPKYPTYPTRPTRPTIPAHPFIQIQAQAQVQVQVQVPVRIREYLIMAVQEMVRAT